MKLNLRHAKELNTKDLAKLVVVQEQQIESLTSLVGKLRQQLEYSQKTSLAWRAVFEEILQADMIDPDTGEVFRAINFDEQENGE